MANCVVIREITSQNPVDYRFALMNQDIQNGCVVKLGDLVEGHRDVYAAATPAATDELWLAVGVELMYEERKAITDYINKANIPFRVERVKAGGTYAISVDGLTASAEIAAGNVVVATAANKLTVKASSASGDTVVGKVIEVYTRAGIKFAAIQFVKD